MSFRSSSRPPPTPRRQSSASANSRPVHPSDSHAADLSQSLQNLSLGTSPGRGSPRTSPMRNVSSSLASPSAVANPRFSPRSPSTGGDSRSGTPNLLRKSSTSSLRSASAGPRQSLSRRASATGLSSSFSKSPLAMAEPIPEPKPVPTANSIAKDFFQADFQFQQGDDDERHTEATVVLHDSCYGHRYSRAYATVEDLASIVERPERLKASTLGVALAYVRLAGLHAEGQHQLHPELDPTTIPNLPFRIKRSNRKMSLLSPAVVAVHGKDTMKELEAMCSTSLSKIVTSQNEIERIQKSKPEFHSGDLYLGPHSLEAMEGALGAVCDAIDTVFGPGPRRSYVSIRPPGHHCSADYPSGFCWVNNVHVGIIYAMMNHGLTHAAIIDIDLHHGDGSQDITWNYNERRAYSKGKGGMAQWKKGSIGYFSLHDIQSYPCESGNLEKTVNASVCIEDAHGQNIWNVHLKPWESKAEFWELYETRYSVLVEKAQSFLKMQSNRLRAAGKEPKSAVFVSAGFDASEWESGGMQRHAASVPTDFYARIAEDVVRMAADPETGTDGRVISVMEGGYSDRAIYSGVCSHLSGLVSIPSGQENEANGSGPEAVHDQARLGAEMGQRLGIAPDKAPLNQSGKCDFASSNLYDPSWWSGPELDTLERVLGLPAYQQKKQRLSLPPTYSSPTHASTARAADPLKLHRSLSRGGYYSRPATPPLPDVPWTIAVKELRNILVPDDRPTDSCTVGEINEIVSRARQDRRVTPPGQRTAAESQGPTPPSGQRAGLRGRRPKMIEAISEEDGVGKARPTTSSALNSSEAQGLRRSNRRASTPSILTSTGTGYVVPGPPSSASSRASDVGGGPPLQVKKTRAAPAARKEPAARASKDPAKKAPTRPAPVKRASTSAVMKGTAKASGTQDAAVSGPSDKPKIKVSESGAQRGEGAGLDQITTGMNKVKITLVNKSGQEKEGGSTGGPGSQAPGAPAPAPTSAPRPRIKIVSRNASPRASTSAGSSPVQFDDSSKQGFQSPVPSISTPAESVSVESPDPLAMSIPLPASSPIDHPGPKTPDMFVPYQPDGPAPVELPVKDVKFLPPNAATPTPMKRADLPTFTSNSAIPFATKEERVKEEERDELWDLPESPSKRWGGGA